MLKQGTKNYFKSLKYFFTPLGTMFLGVMLGLSAFVTGVTGAVNDLVAGITQLSQQVNLDGAALWDNLWTEIRLLNWEEPSSAFQTVVSSDWITRVLTEELTSVLGTDFETFKQQIVSLVSVFGSSVAAGVAAFFVFWLLGFAVGMALTRFCIRRSIAKRSLWKVVLAHLLNVIFSTALVVAMLVIFSVWKYSIIFSVIFALLLSSLVALLQAYLLYAHKKVPFGQIVNFSNVGLHLLVNVIIFAVSAMITAVAVAVNGLMGLFVGLSLFVVTLTVVNLNAESFVQEKVRCASELLAAPVLAEE